MNSYIIVTVIMFFFCVAVGIGVAHLTIKNCIDDYIQQPIEISAQEFINCMYYEDGWVKRKGASARYYARMSAQGWEAVAVHNGVIKNRHFISEEACKEWLKWVRI